MKDNEKDNKMNSIQLSVLDIENKYKLDYADDAANSNTWCRWGTDNNLPMLYRTCYNQSSTLKSIIDGTINYVLGDKIEISDEASFWKNEVNRTGMTMREFIEAIAFNLLVYNGFAYQVIYNKLLVPVEFYPLDFGRCRTNERQTKIYYSKKWSKYQSKYDEYDVWNPDNINPVNPTQIFYYKNRKSQNIYPTPPYNGAVYDILTEIECSKYSLNTVARGFSAKHIINFPENANLTDEQKKGIEDAIKNKFCGSENESNFMLYWMNNAGEKIQIDKVESDETPERYMAIKDNARQNIFVAMRAMPTLFGLPNATNGFSTDEFKDSYKLYQKTVIEPIQDIIVESIGKTMGIDKPIHIQKFDIDFDRDKEAI